MLVLMPTETIQNIQTRADTLGVLFALNDSGYWSEKDLSTWATEVLLQTSKPSVWLMDLVVIETSGKLDQFFGKALLDNQMVLPKWVDTLAAGFVMARHKNGDLSDEQAKNRLADLSDPDPICGITVEDVAGIHLDDARLLRVRREASSLMEQFNTNSISSSLLAAVSV